MEKIDAKELIQRYLSGKISAEERLVVEQWFVKHLEDSDCIPEQLRIIEADKKIWSKLSRHVEDGKRKSQSIRFFSRIAAAAVLMIISFATLFFFNREDQNQQTVEIKSNDVLPGGNKAILTLANGKKIFLAGAGNGNVTQEGGAEITKPTQGEISYHRIDQTSDAPLRYNTISTPRGGTYKLILEDGTEVFLNASSSITYPTTFSGRDRKVNFTGEAYFNVAHNPEKPFKVVSSTQVVEVLGTQFNVSSYNDEPSTETTLLAGSVKVTNDRQNTVYLKPGQQAVGAASLIVQNVNVDEAIAWKNGLFHFKNADVPTVMRDISRWYDVDVEYQGNPTKRRFTGDFYRGMSLSKALTVISYLKIRFRIEGKKIIVIQ